MSTEPKNIVTSILVVLVLCSAVGLFYLGYQNRLLSNEGLALSHELTKTKSDFASTTQKLLLNIDDLKQLLTLTQVDKTAAEENLRKQRDLLETMNTQVEFISGSLSTYKKILETDKELLQKYSKVYFLNENYAPKYSTIIPTQYAYDPKIEKLISTDVWPFLQKMLDDAVASNVDLKITSAFRSFDTQGSLKSAYKVTYGSGSNKFSADQGYSEHQLGTTVDFTTTKLGTNFSTFEKTSTYVWLAENAYKYGFILSYPKNNTYYIFEPWHWRFVGKSLALRLHDEKKNFYDMSQRDINEYLLTIFNL